jgi:hypothetical protein
LREVVCSVLKLREEKWTFVKVGGGKIDFFQLKNTVQFKAQPTHNKKRKNYNGQKKIPKFEI